MTDPQSLGWIKAPDPRNYPLRELLPPVELTRKARPPSALWPYSGAMLDQGQTGTCVGHAVKNFLICEPIDQSSQTQAPTAFDLYDLACDLDGIPDNDNHDRNFGTTTNGGWKALRSLGFVAEWRFAKNMDDVLDWLAAYGPLTFGTDWTQDMFHPGADYFVIPTGSVAGGHEYLVRGYGVLNGKTYLDCVNSWGSSWADHGRFRMWASDAEQLVFKRGGDAAVGLEVAKDPTPPPPEPTPTHDPMGPYQHTEYRGYDRAHNEWVWEFRIQRGTGGWDD